MRETENLIVSLQNMDTSQNKKLFLEGLSYYIPKTTPLFKVITSVHQRHLYNSIMAWKTQFTLFFYPSSHLSLGGICRCINEIRKARPYDELFLIQTEIPIINYLTRQQVFTKYLQQSI